MYSLVEFIKVVCKFVLILYIYCIYFYEKRNWWKVDIGYIYVLV